MSTLVKEKYYNLLQTVLDTCTTGDKEFSEQNMFDNTVQRVKFDEIIDLLKRVYDFTFLNLYFRMPIDALAGFVITSLNRFVLGFKRFVDT